MCHSYCDRIRGRHVRKCDVGRSDTANADKDAADKPASIPDLGNKVLCVLYNDADAADMNDPLADALKAKTIRRKIQGDGNRQYERF